MENNSEITGVRHDDEITGVHSNNESTGVKLESGSTGTTDKADEMALIGEAIEEAQQDIAEGADLLAGTETENEDTWNKNVIHPDSQVPTVEHTYNIRRGSNTRPHYKNIYLFQDKIINFALTQMSMNRELKKFKKKGEKAVTEELEQFHRSDTL